MEENLLESLLERVANDIYVRQPSSEDEVLRILRKHFSLGPKKLEDNFVSTIQIPMINQE